MPFFILLSFVFVSCSSSPNEKETKAKDQYEQTKETLAQTEKKNPLRFLSVEGKNRKNLLRQTVIKGTIISKATVASYKDIDVELSFFSETGALLLRDHEIVYKVIAPGESQDFKYKTYAPKGTDSIAMKISASKVE